MSVDVYVTFVDQVTSHAALSVMVSIPAISPDVGIPLSWDFIPWEAQRSRSKGMCVCACVCVCVCVHTYSTCVCHV